MPPTRADGSRSGNETDSCSGDGSSLDIVSAPKEDPCRSSRGVDEQPGAPPASPSAELVRSGFSANPVASARAGAASRSTSSGSFVPGAPTQGAPGHIDRRPWSRDQYLAPPTRPPGLA